jgi:S1-C subfamily serine protease
VLPMRIQGELRRPIAWKPAVFVSSLVPIVLVSAGCLGGGGGKGTANGLSEQQLIARAGPSVVALKGNVGQGKVGGTGAIVDAAKGLVLTNAHVVSGVTALSARVNDKTDIAAQIVAQAPCDDLAVVRLTTPPPGLKAIALGDSSTVKAGQTVTVLGYPETLDTSGAPGSITATTGGVSQANTSASLDTASIKYPSLIQHQAAINHGNSGGPLLDASGKLIGINTLTAAGAGSGQIQGQYYSISVNQVKGVLSQLENGTSIANLGWNLVPIDTSYLKSEFGTALGNQVVQFLTQAKDTQGLIVSGVDPGSAAAAAHFGPGDYISQINNTPVTSVQSVCDVAKSTAPGQTITVSGRYLGSAQAAGKNVGEPFQQDLKAR